MAESSSESGSTLMCSWVVRGRDGGGTRVAACEDEVPFSGPLNVGSIFSLSCENFISRG
jgi:hypothetical protein